MTKALITEKMEIGLHYNSTKNNLLEIKKRSKNKVELFKFDLTNLSKINNLLKKFNNKFNGITDLVYCATFPIKRRKFFVDLSYNEILRMTYINYLSAMFCFKEAIKIMKLSKTKKTLTYVSSYATKTGGNKISHYVSSKSAIESLFRSIQKEYKNFNIKFLITNPSNIIYDKNYKANKFSSNADSIVRLIKKEILKKN